MKAKYRDTIATLADYYYISRSATNRLVARGVDVHDHLEVERAILNQTHRPNSWINGNPNRHGVNFPNTKKYTERENLVCYCEGGLTNLCVSCRADLDFGCKYFFRHFDTIPERMAKLDLD